MPETRALEPFLPPIRGRSSVKREPGEPRIAPAATTGQGAASSPAPEPVPNVWRAIQIGGSTYELLRAMFVADRITLAEYEAEVERREARRAS
jgi:hypothetical protein